MLSPEKLGWKWIFRVLAILSGGVLLLFVLVLPETSRTLVGDGSLVPIGINSTLVRRRPRIAAVEPMKKPKITIPNPLQAFLLVFHRDALLILTSNAIFYTKYSCVQASLAPVLQQVYSLSTLQVGLCYLAFGAATAVASYGVGKVSNYDYEQTAKAHGLSIDKVKGDAIKDFPMEEARLRSVVYYSFVSSSCTLGYGWALNSHVHLSVPLILQFFVGLAVTGIFNALNTLFVDLHVHQPTTASSALSLTRCMMAAVGVSVLQLLFDAIGYGWTFTLISGLCFATTLPLLLERKYGWHWRLEAARATTR